MVYGYLAHSILPIEAFIAALYEGKNLHEQLDAASIVFTGALINIFSVRVFGPFGAAIVIAWNACATLESKKGGNCPLIVPL